MGKFYLWIVKITFVCAVSGNGCWSYMTLRQGLAALPPPAFRDRTFYRHQKTASSPIVKHTQPLSRP